MPDLIIKVHNRRSVKAIDHQPVLKLLHFFQCINAFVRVAFQNFKQPIRNGWQGIVLAQGQKALRSPTIFRWGCSRTSKTDRIGRMWVAGLLRLNADIVLPQIAKVVFIQEAFRVALVSATSRRRQIRGLIWRSTTRS